MDDIKLLRYRQQKAGAKRRGIAWEFTFDDWSAVWDESGKWDRRGTKRGQYVMARNGDVGPYSRTNVAIVLGTQNACEALMKHPGMTGNTNRLGTGGGVSFDPRLKLRPYQVKFRSKSLGHYATEEEGRAAYRAAVDAYVSAIGLTSNRGINHERLSGIGQ